MRRFVKEGGIVESLNQDFVIHTDTTDVVVDALFGTGLVQQQRLSLPQTATPAHGISQAGAGREGRSIFPWH